MALNSVFNFVVLLFSLLFLQGNAQNSTASVTATAAAATTTAGPVASTANATATVSIQPSATQTTNAASSTAAPTASASPGATTAPPPATGEMKGSAKLTSETFTSDLKNESSDAYKTLNKKFTEALEAVSPAGSTVNIDSFDNDNGKVVANYTITYKVVKGYDFKANLTAILKTGTLGTFTIDKNSINFELSFKGVTVGEYQLDSASYLDNCCTSSIGQFKRKRTCIANTGHSCYGIQLEYEEDCGKATNPPTCSKACSLANMSIMIMLLGLIASKIFA